MVEKEPQERTRNINWNGVFETRGVPLHKSGRLFHRMTAQGLIEHGKRQTEFNAEGTGKRETQALQRLIDDATNKTVSFLEKGPVKNMTASEIELVAEKLRSYIAPKNARQL